MDLYARVQFADGTTGLILSIKHEGNSTIFTVLTDSYDQVICDPDQVGEINWRDVPMLKVESHETGGKI